MMNPFVSGVIGAALGVAITRSQAKKKANGKKKKRKALSPPEEIYTDPDLPDVIDSGENARFSIELYDDAVQGRWSLVGLPPDGSVEFERVRRVASGGKVTFDFRTVKPGGGSLVFHMRSHDSPDEPQPAIDIVDIQVRVR